jgi:hypothetical protein
MAFKLNDLPPKLRKQVEANAVGREVSVPARRRPVQRSKKSDADNWRGEWRCASCPETFRHWAKAERHADATGHSRIEVVLNTAPPERRPG